jgi:AraC-like DNA-binding protein
MVEKGQGSIRRVRFLPPGPDVGDIEVNTIRGIRDRGGPQEFLTLQRLDFDLLVHVEGGNALHTVDFIDYALRSGDVLWIRAGQVHRWGRIEDLEGRVVMFGPHAVDDRTAGLVRPPRLSPRNHWPAADLAGTPVVGALVLPATRSDTETGGRSDLRRAGLAHNLAALLIYLTLVGSAAEVPHLAQTHEAYTWFRDHIEEHYRSWHKVNEYAERLGYSSRTLNRLARHHTGSSAKELIDERLVLEAKRLLSHADGSVAQIAEGLGFEDASNFSSYFRKQAGMTPGAFRRSSRGH